MMRRSFSLMSAAIAAVMGAGGRMGALFSNTAAEDAPIRIYGPRVYATKNVGKDYLKDVRRFDPSYHRSGQYGALRLARRARMRARRGA